MRGDSDHNRARHARARFQISVHGFRQKFVLAGQHFVPGDTNRQGQPRAVRRFH